MNTSDISSALNAGAFAAVTVPTDSPWVGLAYSVLSAVLGAVLSWLSRRTSS